MKTILLFQILVLWAAASCDDSKKVDAKKAEKGATYLFPFDYETGLSKDFIHTRISYTEKWTTGNMENDID
jgi:hypothetical protein